MNRINKLILINKEAFGCQIRTKNNTVPSKDLYSTALVVASTEVNLTQEDIGSKETSK